MSKDNKSNNSKLSKEEQQAQLIIGDLLGFVIPFSANLTPRSFLPKNQTITEELFTVMKEILPNNVQEKKDVLSEIVDLEKKINGIYKNINTQSGGNGNVKQFSLSILLTFALLVGLVAYLTNEQIIRFELNETAYNFLYGDRGTLCNAQQLRRALYVRSQDEACRYLQHTEDIRNERVETFINTFLSVAGAVGAGAFTDLIRQIKEGNGGKVIVDIYNYFQGKVNNQTFNNDPAALPVECSSFYGEGSRNGQGFNNRQDSSGSLDPSGPPELFRNGNNENNRYGGKKKRKMRKTKKGRLCKNKKRTTYRSRRR